MMPVDLAVIVTQPSLNITILDEDSMCIVSLAFWHILYVKLSIHSLVFTLLIKCSV